MEDAAPTYTRRAELRGAELVDATNDQLGLCRALTSLRLAIEDGKPDHRSKPEPSVVASPGETNDVDNMVAASSKQQAMKAGPKAGPRRPPKAKAKAKAGAKTEPKKPMVRTTIAMKK